MYALLIRITGVTGVQPMRKSAALDTAESYRPREDTAGGTRGGPTVPNITGHMTDTLTLASLLTEYHAP